MFVEMPRNAAAVSIPSLSVRQIQDAVARKYEVSHQALVGKMRLPHIIHARHVAMTLVYWHKKRRRHSQRWSYKQTAAYFGGRHHTTVIHAVQKIGKRAISDPVLRFELAELRLELGL